MLVRDWLLVSAGRGGTAGLRGSEGECVGLSRPFTFPPKLASTSFGRGGMAGFTLLIATVGRATRWDYDTSSRRNTDGKPEQLELDSQGVLVALLPQRVAQRNFRGCLQPFLFSVSL